jgi:hypothetical protein
MIRVARLATLGTLSLAMTLQSTALEKYEWL